MTEQERYQKRRAYFAEYAKRNRDKRAAAAKAWRERNRELGDVVQEGYDLRYRVKMVSTPRPRPVKTVKKPRVIVSREKLLEKFAAYRAAKRKEQS